jgi:hypothetical protein
MKRVLPILAFLVLSVMVNGAQTPKDFAEAWDKNHVSHMLPSNVRHSDLLTYLEKLKTLGLKVEQAGRSYGGRGVFQAEWGRGKFKVLLWSQMHGDEPTATSALVDLLAFLQTNQNVGWVKKLSEALTLRAVPMLNPDGAELYQRRNLQFIDINRDARRLSTPEGVLLKKLRDEWSPDLAFNLHNQEELITVGETKKQAAISLLAVSGDENGASDAGHQRSRRLCSLMVKALEPFIKGHIARYDDEYNPRAFGDMIAAWGTPVILVETGGLHGADGMFLVKMNFVAYLTALQAVADGSEKSAPTSVYDELPFNSGGGLFHYIFRRATIASGAGAPYLADVAVIAERRRAGDNPSAIVREVGDLSIFAGLEEFDLKDFYLVPAAGPLRPGSQAGFALYKKTKVPDLNKLPEPDAVFRQGNWIKPLKVS